MEKKRYRVYYNSGKVSSTDLVAKYLNFEALVALIVGFSTSPKTLNLTIIEEESKETNGNDSTS